LTVGDVVVYAAYGIGRIAARKPGSVAGSKEECVVVEFPGGLTVSLPMERAHNQLRPLASEADLRRVRKTLREAHSVSDARWLSRQRDVRAKLATGDAVSLAEIVREGASRRASLKGTGKPQLAEGEREVFSRAWQLLAGEIARVRGLDVSEADAWIDRQLARS